MRPSHDRNDDLNALCDAATRVLAARPDVWPVAVTLRTPPHPDADPVLQFVFTCAPRIRFHLDGSICSIGNVASNEQPFIVPGIAESSRHLPDALAAARRLCERGEHVDVKLRAPTAHEIADAVRDVPLPADPKGRS